MDLKEKYKREKESFENEVKKRDFLENELQDVSADILERKGRLELLEELIAGEEAEEQAKKEIAGIEAKTQADVDTTSEVTHNKENKS